MTSAQGRTHRFHIMPQVRFCLFSMLAFTLLVGCRYRDPSIELLEGELRWMEDQLYMLEDELQSKSAQLAECQGQHCQYETQPLDASQNYSSTPQYSIEEPIVMEGPQVELPDSQPTPAEPRDSGSFRDPSPTDADEFIRPPDDVDSDYGYEIVEPTVEIPEDDPLLPDSSLVPGPAEPEPMPSDGNDAFPGEAPLLNQSQSLQPVDPTSPLPSSSDVSIRLQSYDQPASHDAPISPMAGQVDAHVTHVVAEGRLSGGYDFDNYRTDDDLLVVIEPRNAAGQYVALAGPISVVALDGTKTGASARVGRWDFDAAEARRRIRVTNDGQGIHLQLAWPDQKSAPSTDKIYLFVRYLTVEGRKLETDQLLSPSLPAASNGTWKVVRRQPQGASTAQWITTPVEQPKATVATLLPTDAGLELKPTPSPDSKISAFAERTAEPTPVEMPVIRASSLKRPEWSPNR